MLLYIYLTLAALISFSLMAADKSAAQQNRQRIAEKTLLIAAFCGGSPGIILGMLLFRHKRRKTVFRLQLMVILALQILLMLLMRPIP